MASTIDGVAAAAGAAAPGEDASPPPPAAIVFQCAGCRRVVGDSLALINADEGLRSITLHGACGIVRSPCTRTAEAGKDQGSTYHELFCQGCNAPLGRVYLTTAPALDLLRNLFTFDTDALESYELGRYDHALELPEHLKPPPPMVLGPAGVGGAGNATAAAAATAGEGAAAAAPEIQMELTKLQNMMLVFHDRISTLEKALKKANSAGSSNHGGRKSMPSSSTSLAALADENSPPPPSNKRKKQR